MLVSKKSRSLLPPSDRILRSARAESKRLICSGEENFEPITTSVIINIGPQNMEGSSPLNADSILERMASPVGRQPSPMEPVNPHPCYYQPPNVQPQYQQFHQHPGPPPLVVPVIDPMMLPRGLPDLVPQYFGGGCLCLVPIQCNGELPNLAPIASSLLAAISTSDRTTASLGCLDRHQTRAIGGHYFLHPSVSSRMHKVCWDPTQ
jgi:hypothetical protein